MQWVGGADRMLELIRVLYGASIRQGAWAEFLKVAAIVFQAQRMRLTRQDPRTLLVDFSADYSDETEADLPCVSSDSGPGRLQSLPADELSVERGQDRAREMAASFTDASGCLVSLVASRSKASGQFSSADAVLFHHLLPHLKRAMDINVRATLTVAQTQAARCALDSLRLGVVVVDAAASIAQSNLAAKELLESGDGVSASRGTLRADRHEDTVELRRMILGAIQDGDNVRHRAISVARPSAADPLHIVVSAVQRRAGGVSNVAYPLAALLISSPDMGMGICRGTLKDLYGLTTAEVRVCEELMAGYSPREIGVRLNITFDTCRTHLKRCYGKLSVGNQAALVGKIARNPAWLGRYVGSTGTTSA